MGRSLQNAKCKMQSANCLKFVRLSQLKTVLVVIISLAIVQEQSARADWRQFRGPNGQGHSAVRDLPIRFSDTQNVSWKTPIPGSMTGVGDAKLFFVFFEIGFSREKTSTL